MTRAAATIVSANRLAHAEVIARSFVEFHPDVPFFVLIADRDVPSRPGAQYQMIPFAALALDHPEHLAFRYSQQPLSYALTPNLLEHLLESFEQVIFFKQESLVLGSHDEVFELVGRHSIVLTPHLVEPLRGPDRIEREKNILQSGIFNIGLLGVSRSASSSRFLRWWAERTAGHTIHSVPEGMHFEQRWVDLVLSYFDDVAILRDPAFNVAHWNLPDRVVVMREGRPFVGEVPARLFRFSGFDPDQNYFATRYSERLHRDNMGASAIIFDRYAALLGAAGDSELRQLPYGFGQFDNGEPISDRARERYAALGGGGGEVRRSIPR